ncbi:MAG: RNA methyltransferase [Chloroflexota bacterium]|nr:RNA methyltransferase [Chloroflexota bacterium]
MLTSTKNPRIKLIRRLQARSRNRRKEKLFVIEGVRLAEEAFEAGCKPEMVLFTDGLSSRGHQLVESFRPLDVEIVSVAPQVMRAASDTQTPQGILAVMPLQGLPLPDDLQFVLIPDGVRDPGNIGTLLRTALAAGVDAVLLPPGNVDAYDPKVVRAGMGAHFRLPIHIITWDKIRRLAEASNLSIHLADSAGGQPHFQASFESPLGIIIGGEAAGAGDQARGLATSRIHIPMPGKAESLNTAIAGAVLMFEVVRQRQLL